MPDYVLTPITPNTYRLTIQAPVSLLSVDLILAELESLADSLDGRLCLLVEIVSSGEASSPLIYPRCASMLRRYAEMRLAELGASSRSVLYGLAIIVEIARATHRLRVFDSESEALVWLANRPASAASGAD